MRVAIVYDWIDKQGGVERLLQSLLKAYPEAELFTSIYSPEAAPWANGLVIRTSFMQKLPRFIKNSRILSSILFPYAFESFNFNGYDLVISVTSSFAKGVITRPETNHICILLTSTRYLWGLKDAYRKSAFFTIMAAPFLEQMRKWDFIAAQRPDIIYSISKLVAERCLKDYGRESEILYPPFDTPYWQSIVPEAIDVPNEFYLVVARLEPYKKIELVLESFAQMKDKNCLIVGSGSQDEQLKAKAGGNITFLKDISDAKLAFLYSKARALIMPQEEDFGYTALEATFFNCPVISYKHSGTAEIVMDRKTGTFFEYQTADSLRAALERFASVPYNVSSYTKEVLERFSLPVFLDTVTRFKQN